MKLLKNNFFVVTFFVFGFFSKVSADTHYQDLVVNGQTVKPGYRMCASRYESLKTVLDKYKRPITVLDIGAAEGYFTFKIAHDYDSVCVMVEMGGYELLMDLCRRNTELDNVVYLHKTINVAELEKLSMCEHFDVVLLFNVAHHVPQWKRFIDAVFKLGDNIIVETPPASDKHFINIGMGHRIREIEQYFSRKGQGKIIAETPRHTDPTVNAKMTWYEKKKTSISKAYWLYPGIQAGPWRIVSDYEKKIFIKDKSEAHEERPWIPGINLLTFKMLNGVYPEKDFLSNCLHELKDIPHPDGFLWNMILQGKNLRFIDLVGESLTFDSEKIYNYNLEILNFSDSRMIERYIKNTDRIKVLY